MRFRCEGGVMPLRGQRTMFFLLTATVLFSELRALCSRTLTIRQENSSPSRIDPLRLCIFPNSRILINITPARVVLVLFTTLALIEPMRRLTTGPG